jgi:misacylated tRNA(Ala) deacylase
MHRKSWLVPGPSGCRTALEGPGLLSATPSRAADSRRRRLPPAYLRCRPAPDLGTLHGVRTQLCYTDAYAREVESTVVAVEPGIDGAGALVTLDATVFYPGGGGQPADRGSLRSTAAAEPIWTVRSARKSSGDIVHELEPGDDPPAVGETVLAEIDWDRRHALMRTHTALHALCGVVWRDYGALVTGGNMEPGSGRMDFEFERMSGDLVEAIEATVNEELRAARDVRVNVLPRAEAFAIPDLIRTKVNLLPEGIEEIRTIEIVGLDLQADGGTHVANTREVGGIRVTGYESKGRINKRIRIELGDAPAA